MAPAFSPSPVSLFKPANRLIFHPLTAAVHGYTTGFWWAAGIFAAGLVMALLILPWKAEARECTLRTALTRGIAYALHLEATAAAGATHTLRMSPQTLPRAGSSLDRSGSSDHRDTPAAHHSP